MSPIRLVTFDVTGTLLNFRRPVMNQYAEVAAQYGIKKDPKKLEENFKTSWKNMSAEHPNFGRTTGLGWREWWLKVVEGTFNEETRENNYGGSSSVRKIGQELLLHFETEDAWKVVDGGISLLESIKADNVKIGVISNFDPRLHAILRNVGLVKYFNFVLTSYDVGHAKPSHIIFHTALNTCGIIDGREALHVGNDPKMDYGGATTAGLHSVLVSEESPLLLPKIVNKISQVKDCIDIINRP